MKKNLIQIPALLAVLGLLAAVGCAQSPTSGTNEAASAVGSKLAAIPSQFHGAWTGEPSGIHPREAELPMVIASRKVEGHEWGGDAISVVSNGANDITVTIEGWAEGDSFVSQQRWILSPDASSMQVINVGNASGASLLYRARGWDRSQSAYGD
jgi:hypothetical protein